jgi:hypothetical protein
VQAQQPSIEIGAVNLDGEFIARESKVEEQVSGAQASEEPGSEDQSSEEEITPLLE